MTAWYDPNNENIKPGGRIAFGGGMIDRHRKIHDVPEELIQTAIRAYYLLVRSGWVYNKHSYDFGVICNNINAFLSHGDWKPFRDLHLSMVSDSTIDRARKIASNIKIDPYSSFLSVAQDPLLKMLRKYSFDEAVNLLKQNGTNLYLKQDDTEGIAKFKFIFKDLINGDLELLQEEESEEFSIGGDNGNQLTSDSDSELAETELDPAVCKYVSYIKDLHQFHKDTGELLDRDIISDLTDILVETGNVLFKFGPKIARGEKFQGILASLEELQDDIFDSSLDEGLDAEGSNSDSTCEVAQPASNPIHHNNDKTSNPNIYKSFEEIEHLTSPPTNSHDDLYYIREDPTTGPND